MGGRAVVVNDEKEDEGQRKTIRQYEQRKMHVVSPSLARALSSVPRSPTFPVACCVCALAPIWCKHLSGLHINTHEIPFEVSLNTLPEYTGVHRSTPAFLLLLCYSLPINELRTCTIPAPAPALATAI